MHSASSDPWTRIRLIGQLPRSGHMYSILVDDALAIEVTPDIYLSENRTQLSRDVYTRHRQMREIDGISVMFISARIWKRIQRQRPLPNYLPNIRDLIMRALPERE